MTLDQPRFTGQWRLGFLERGRVRVTGTAGVAARLRAWVRSSSDGKVYAKREFSSAAGRYSATLRLPARPLPGRYRVYVVGLSPVLPRVDRNVTVPTPPEGVVDRAVVSARRGGPGVTVLRGSRHEAWARFHFLTPPPRGRKLTIQWRTPSYQLICQSSRGPLKGCRLPVDYAETVTTHVRSFGAPLAFGKWEARLSVGGKLARKTFVRLRP